MTRARAEQQAVVDLLKGDLARIRKQVGAADYQKIDAHLEGVLAMERRIMPPPTTPTDGRLHDPARADEPHRATTRTTRRRSRR